MESFSFILKYFLTVKIWWQTLLTFVCLIMSFEGYFHQAQFLGFHLFFFFLSLERFLVSSGLHCFWWAVSCHSYCWYPVYIMCLSLFWERFSLYHWLLLVDCNSVWYFLYWTAWDSLSFSLDFHQIWKTFSHYFFK